ncbi:MAG: deoxyribonuclease IV, partial [Acidimicrobiia bacterium]
MGVRIGAHVPSAHPLEEASQRDVDVVQIFLSSPHQWRPPMRRVDAEALSSAGIPVYVHAPYLINLASGNPRVRYSSRRLLTETVHAAEWVGASGVVLHGGHATGEATVDEGLVRWAKALEPIESPVPILIENTAGGDRAMARSIDDLARLWESIGGFGVGFCLDTCHAWAAGEELEDLVSRVVSATGRIDLVHANDSKDSFGSRRDRHTNLGDGQIPAELL